MGTRIIKLIMLSSFLLLTVTAQAQRTLPSTGSVDIRGGMVDGIHTHEKTNEMGYYLGLGFSTYVKNSNKWVFGVEYLNKKYPYQSKGIPIAQFTVEGGYYYNLLSDASKIFFIHIGGSALAGYETVNWGEKRLDDGATIQNKDCLLYGGAITIELDSYLNDFVILTLFGRERFLWGTTSGHFHFQFGLGLKFIIN